MGTRIDGDVERDRITCLRKKGLVVKKTRLNCLEE